MILYMSNDVFVFYYFGTFFYDGTTVLPTTWHGYYSSVSFWSEGRTRFPNNLHGYYSLGPSGVMEGPYFQIFYMFITLVIPSGGWKDNMSKYVGGSLVFSNFINPNNEKTYTGIVSLLLFRNLPG